MKDLYKHKNGLADDNEVILNYSLCSCMIKYPLSINNLTMVRSVYGYRHNFIYLLLD